MRPPLLRQLIVGLPLLLLAGCGPKVNMGSPFDHDDERAGQPLDARLGLAAPPQAPPGPGLRAMTVQRADMDEALAAGPAGFLQQFEVTARTEGERFIGWQLVQILDQASILHQLDLQNGDILLTINGSALSKPDELMGLWTSLAQVSQIVCELQRGDSRFTITVAIAAPTA